MTQIKRVPFNYEYFKANPETNLETRGGEEARFIGETFLSNNEDCKLAFETKNLVYRTSIDGLFIIDDEDENEDDILMLIEAKEVIAYGSVYDVFIASAYYDTLEEAIKGHGTEAKSVAKFTIVDGEIVKCETVHKY